MYSVISKLLIYKFMGQKGEIMFILGKVSLIITTRCNLRCKLCDEYAPENKPFPDMTLDEERRLLAAVFDLCDHVETLHLTGGGEPFLHKQLAEMIETAMGYSYVDLFDGTSIEGSL